MEGIRNYFIFSISTFAYIADPRVLPKIVIIQLQRGHALTWRIKANQQCCPQE